MSVTIDLKMLLLIIICIAIIILVFYFIRFLKSMMATLEHTNRVLEDIEVITDIAAKRSKNVDGIIENVSETVSEISDTIQGKQNILSVISAIFKAAMAVKNSKENKME